MFWLSDFRTIPLVVGASIAHYKITAKLGQGGMGVVYRATDTKLGRDVAVKVLPESFAQDKERLTRFEREATTLASLNHPNIAGIYGLEQYGDSQALILELVEGEDLFDRIQRGPLALDETKDICRQIAEALATAHAKGIIHRDLKPGNIKVTAEGKVVVLDFGLAKALLDESATLETTTTDDSPTITDAFTRPGSILGTAAYMSPEQARGKHLDKRSDVWAFGCILFECLTGKKAFRGEDATEILASVLKDEPDWDLIPASAPDTLRLLLRKCLNKDRRQRLRDMDDARLDLDLCETGSLSRPDQQSVEDRGIMTLTQQNRLLLSLLLIISMLLVWKWKPDNPMANGRPPEGPRRSELLFPTRNPFFTLFYNNAISLSKDGSQLAYSLSESDRKIYQRNLVTGKNGKIPGIEGMDLVSSPFFSPDGKWVGFIDSDSLYRIKVDGGNPERLYTADSATALPGAFGGADWGIDGSIVMAVRNQPLQLIPEEGGQAIPITSLESGEFHVSPQFLGDHEHILYLSKKRGNYWGLGQAHILNLKTKESRPLDVEACLDIRYVASGHLLYAKNGDVFSLPFDLSTLLPSGQKKRVLSRVQMMARAQFSVSARGDLVYLEGGQDLMESTSLVWVGKDSDSNLTLDLFSTQKGDWSEFSLAPQSQQAAVVIGDGLWLLDCRDRRDLPPRPLVNQEICHSPVWSRDGTCIYYYSFVEGKHCVRKIDIQAAVNSSVTIFESENVQLWPESASDDWLLMSRVHEEFKYPGTDIWKLSLNQTDFSPQPFLAEGSAEAYPVISPNGNWVAYVSDETSNPQIHLTRMEGRDRGQVFSSQGGYMPQWSSDGGQLFWRLQNSFRTAKISVESNQLLAGDSEEELLWFPFVIRGDDFAVSQDGSRFLVLTSQNHVKQFNETSKLAPVHLKIISNWFEEFK